MESRSSRQGRDASGAGKSEPIRSSGSGKKQEIDLAQTNRDITDPPSGSLNRPQSDNIIKDDI
jgi:hypothetical protein